MTRLTFDPAVQPSLSGALFGAIAFFIWGISPLYWKTLTLVPAFEIVVHRVIWSFGLLMILILARKRLEEFVSVIRNLRAMLILVITSLIVSCNWLVYIWAINNDFLLQASLGYYINPLVNVILGALFLQERLRSLQLFSVIIAAAGVFYLTFVYGQFPWIACVLALTFGFYGLIRKVIEVGSLVGLAIETLFLLLPAIGYLFYLEWLGRAAFMKTGLHIDLLLMGASVVTALPLLLFAMSARRIMLTTLGFLQYIAPSCMFFMAVFIFREAFKIEQLISFILIWTALVIYTYDSVRNYRRNEPQT